MKKKENWILFWIVAEHLGPTRISLIAIDIGPLEWCGIQTYVLQALKGRTIKWVRTLSAMFSSCNCRVPFDDNGCFLKSHKYTRLQNLLHLVLSILQHFFFVSFCCICCFIHSSSRPSNQPLIIRFLRFWLFYFN